jgi:hypothetical protein
VNERGSWTRDRRERAVTFESPPAFRFVPYSGISPFGFNGRFIYTKISLVL